MAHYVSAFYHFMHLDQHPQSLIQLKESLQNKASELQIRGLVVLGPEGINSTSSAPSSESLQSYKNFILDLFKVPSMNFKDSVSEKPPFRKFVVKIREEIVTAGIPEMFPPEGVNHHLSGEEWNQVLKEDPKAVVIDTRNWYEYKIGTFKRAINPNIEKFTEFPAYLEKQNISKDQKMLIFCTGGIRCEKGILELQKQGYSNVYQLDGGILKYLEQHPDDQYVGECFVFDHRVALDQKLQPSNIYGLCPHCGQPSATEIDCKRCDLKVKICEACAEIEWKKDTCSKNCAYQYKLHPERKAPHQWVPFEMERELWRDALATAKSVPTFRPQE